MHSPNTYAQDKINPSAVNGNGQSYAGDGATYTGTWSGTVVCNDLVCTAGNWTNASSSSGGWPQCLSCHQYDAGQGYLLSGHKNTLRKDGAGYLWDGTDGNQYLITDNHYQSGSIYNWTAGTVTVGPGPEPAAATLANGLGMPLDPTHSYSYYNSTQPLFYLLGGWIYYGGSSDPTFTQLNTVFEYGFTGEQYPNGDFDCARCHATGYNFIASSSLGGSGGPEPTTTALAAIPDAEFKRVPTDGYVAPGATNGTSSWYLTGVQCEACHNANGHPEKGTPTVATDQAATALCLECHRGETVNTVNNTIQPDSSLVTHDRGYCSDLSGHPYSSCTATWIYKPVFDYAEGLTFLNSPHAEFVGTLSQNHQNSPDLTITISGSYSQTAATPEGQYFLETSGADSGQNMGCTGCHDPHYPAVNQTALQGSTQTNCGGCHSYLVENILQTIKHPTGAGTPFPTGTSADVPGACAVCHMQAASPSPSYPTQGAAQNHLFRVSVDPNYYTYPTPASYYSGNTAPGTEADGTFTAAVWNDVDIACGQCHGGGVSGQNPYGIVPPYPAPPAFTRTYLANAATGIHGTDTMPTAATPTFSPAPGTYATAQTVTISDTSSGANIYYTTNGTTPTVSPTDQYTGPITVSTNTTIEAIAGGPNYLTSPVASATYDIQAATPTFSLASGTYYKPQSVSISDTTSGTNIYYTTCTFQNQGPLCTPQTPTTSSTLYTGPITVSVPTVMEAIAGGNNYTASNVATLTITIKALAPSFSPGGGTYIGAQTVTITNSSSSPGASIYYAVNAAPTTSSTSCSSPCSVTVSASETLEAVSTFDSGLLSESSVASATYVIRAPAPTFSPPAGTYRGTQSVTLSDTASGVTICYTTNGTTPALGATGGTCTNGTPYTFAITVSVTTTIKAIAGLNGYAASTVASATYTIIGAAYVVR